MSGRSWWSFLQFTLLGGTARGLASKHGDQWTTSNTRRDDCSALRSAKLNPYPSREAKAKAADSLLKEFAELARKQGFDAGQVTDTIAYYVQIPHGSFSVRLLADGESFTAQRFQYGHYVGEARHEQLVFDCVSNTFCGVDVDADVAPNPGQRLPREHALVVLARLTADLLTTTGET